MVLHHYNLHTLTSSHMHTHTLTPSTCTHCQMTTLGDIFFQCWCYQHTPPIPRPHIPSSPVPPIPEGYYLWLQEAWHQEEVCPSLWTHQLCVWSSVTEMRIAVLQSSFHCHWPDHSNSSLLKCTTAVLPQLCLLRCMQSTKCIHAEL